MPDIDRVVDSGFAKLTIDNVQQHIIVNNKQEDNRKRKAGIDQNATIFVPRLPGVSGRHGRSMLRARLTLKADEGMNTGVQDTSSTRLNRRSNDSLHTAYSAESTEGNGKILQPNAETESIPAGNIEMDTHDTIRTNSNHTFYNHQPLSLYLDQRYFPDQKNFSRHECITEEENFPNLNKLFPRYIIAPEPLPPDELCDPGLFDKLLEDVRHAEDPKYRTLVTVTAFWEDVRAQLRDEDLSSVKTTAFEDEAGVGLGIVFPREAIVEPKQLRIELKKASGPSAKAFGDPNFLQVIRNHLMKRNRRKILEMSGNGYPLRAQTPTPSPRASEQVIEQETEVWSMKGKLQEVIEQLQLKTSMTT